MSSRNNLYNYIYPVDSVTQYSRGSRVPSYHSTYESEVVAEPQTSWTTSNAGNPPAYSVYPSPSTISRAGARLERVQEERPFSWYEEEKFSFSHRDPARHESTSSRIVAKPTSRGHTQPTSPRSSSSAHKAPKISAPKPLKSKQDANCPSHLNPMKQKETNTTTNRSSVYSVTEPEWVQVEPPELTEEDLRRQEYTGKVISQKSQRKYPRNYILNP